MKESSLPQIRRIEGASAAIEYEEKHQRNSSQVRNKPFSRAKEVYLPKNAPIEFKNKFGEVGSKVDSQVQASKVEDNVRASFEKKS